MIRSKFPAAIWCLLCYCQALFVPHFAAAAEVKSSSDGLCHCADSVVRCGCACCAMEGGRMHAACHAVEAHGEETACCRSESVPFTACNITAAGCAGSPLEDFAIDAWRVPLHLRAQGSMPGVDGRIDPRRTLPAKRAFSLIFDLPDKIPLLLSFSFPT